MKKLITGITAIFLLSALIVACGKGAKDKKGELTDLKTELEKLKKDKTKLDDQIRGVEKKIMDADPEAARQIQRLVSIDTIRTRDFSHYIELQGKIDADGMAYVAPSGMGGLVKSVYVKAGDKVSKGQLVVKLDDAIPRQSVIAAQQQVSVLNTRLAQAQTVYERYQNLWKQNIGAEIQVINAKADVDALQSQVRAAQSQVNQAQESVRMTNVYAEISGVIDEMHVKPGEFFSPQTAATPGAGIKIVNGSKLKIVTNVPDNYVSRVKKGDSVLVVVPNVSDVPFASKISVVGASINPQTRSFLTEALLPSNPLLKPNLTATMKILDYAVKGAVTVPVNVVQSDEKGKYIYVIEKNGTKMIARKRNVTVGEVYEGYIEIKSGLSGGDMFISEGYQIVYDGQSVTTTVTN